jgi:hypothetical protein
VEMREKRKNETKVRETDAGKKELAAWQIFQRTSGAHLGDIDAGALEDPASLMEASNHGVQRGTVATLSLFESRARFAVPKLMEIRGKIDCPVVRGDNSTGVMRTAIQRIAGANLPSAPCLQTLERDEVAPRESSEPGR